MSQQPAPAFTALARLKDSLVAAQMPGDDVSFILGRLTRLVTDGVIEQISAALDSEQVKELASILDEEQKLAKMAELFQAKTGKSIETVREELTEKLVAEYEAAA